MVEAADSGRTELGSFGASINLVYASESKVYYTDDLASAANANNEFSESNWLKGEIKVNTDYEANILHDIASWENDELCLGDKSGLSTGESSKVDQLNTVMIFCWPSSLYFTSWSSTASIESSVAGFCPLAVRHLPITFAPWAN